MFRGMRVAGFVAGMSLGLAVPPPAHAAVCIAGTLASYLLSGSCTIGKVVFSNFVGSSSGIGLDQIFLTPALTSDQYGGGPWVGFTWTPLVPFTATAGPGGFAESGFYFEFDAPHSWGVLVGVSQPQFTLIPGAGLDAHGDVYTVIGELDHPGGESAYESWNDQGHTTIANFTIWPYEPSGLRYGVDTHVLAQDGMSTTATGGAFYVLGECPYGDDPGGPFPYACGRTPTVVPEPTTIALVGTGLTGLLGAVARRRQRMAKGGTC